MAQLNAMTMADLDDMQQEIALWHRKASADLAALHAKLSSRIKTAHEAIATHPVSVNSASSNTVAQMFMNSVKGPERDPGHVPSIHSTPQRQVKPAILDDASPALASPPMGHGINFQTIIDDIERDSKLAKVMSTPSADDKSKAHRPTKDSVSVEALNAVKQEDKHKPCQVLVEFKRKRVLQFESASYVAPGEYVVVGGDRGEDIGLVTYTWVSSQGGSAPDNVAKWTGTNLGHVVKIATPMEVAQLHGVQTQLEARAVDVAQQKVEEHGLPMRIVDAEYQFDRKKLTFFYQAHQRLDFRNLVRDLYKTFRARIWMEMD